MSGSFLDRDRNNYDLVRLMAASAVIYAHSYAIAPRPGQVNADLILRWTGVTHLGELAVSVFFFLSGVFVTKSYFESSSISDFILKRVLRIYPGLMVSVLLNVLLIVPLFGGVSLMNYLVEPQTWHYMIKNMICFTNEHFIPGAYQNHPTPALNGSLWSITLELRLYFVWALVGLIGFRKSPLAGTCICLLGIILGMATHDVLPLLGSNPDTYGANAFPTFSLIFTMGALVYIHRAEIHSLGAAVIMSGLFLYLGWHTGLLLWLLFAFAIAVATWFGTTKVARKIGLPGDYSFGVYLYGWPSQQIIVSIWPDAPTLVSAALALVVAVSFAIFSWHCVEKPAMNWGKRLLKARLTRPLRESAALAN
ncbi:peptidoglycan/LPS O-acetylase OafA/YrhL [Silvimonas terrae]|uniref:Peptidoglycan/LPS O-acetylase OafA/YrhL n=1 Tax=Silvimonas terrae TaxID=300266 RepID=A0A840RIP8_9NEIS|nr:acyltransferase [Silvimonas terrae]MBB5192464.1 peptidoglycan/LPS O-acetylase OafA/YrhL [Silvimonas terrae]